MNKYFSMGDVAIGGEEDSGVKGGVGEGGVAQEFDDLVLGVGFEEGLDVQVLGFGGDGGKEDRIGSVLDEHLGRGSEEETLLLRLLGFLHGQEGGAC